MHWLSVELDPTANEQKIIACSTQSSLQKEPLDDEVKKYVENDRCCSQGDQQMIYVDYER